MSQGGTYKVLIDILSERSLVLLHCSSLGSSKLQKACGCLQEREIGDPEQAGAIPVSPVSRVCTAPQMPPKIAGMVLSLSPTLGRDVLPQSCPPF